MSVERHRKWDSCRYFSNLYYLMYARKLKVGFYARCFIASFIHITMYYFFSPSFERVLIISGGSLSFESKLLNNHTAFFSFCSTEAGSSSGNSPNTAQTLSPRLIVILAAVLVCLLFPWSDQWETSPGQWWDFWVYYSSIPSSLFD